MRTLSRPSEMFDRDREWAALVDFATDPAPGAMLGVVSGRRRQGKTFLLRALCQATGGFYFAADEAADGESLRQIGSELAAHLGAVAPSAFDGWHQVVDALLMLGRNRPIPVVIDEFPYLAKANPRLPSVIQNALAPLRAERDTSRTRLLLCGSAMSFMGRLLSGSAPLRGRAGLELVVPTLDHRLAAEFWGLDDAATALKVNAIVGGTPAYRREFARDDTPAGPRTSTHGSTGRCSPPAARCSAKPGTCWPTSPTCETPGCTTPFSPRSQLATPTAAALPPTWDASPATWHIRSPSYRTAG